MLSEHRAVNVFLYSHSAPDLPQQLSVRLCAVHRRERDADRSEEGTGLSDEALYTRAFATAAVSSAMRQIHRHESRLRRSGEKARTELEQLQTLRTDVEKSLMAAYGRIIADWWNNIGRRDYAGSANMS